MHIGFFLYRDCDYVLPKEEKSLSHQHIDYEVCKRFYDFVKEKYPHSGVIIHSITWDFIDWNDIDQDYYNGVVEYYEKVYPGFAENHL